MEKSITVVVGKTSIAILGGHFTMNAGDYNGNITCVMSDDIKNALIAFTSLLIETEE